MSHPGVEAQSASAPIVPIVPHERRRALISVSDKAGVDVMARGLVELGFEILSTGGTLRHLEQRGVAVTPVAAVTGSPEILDGRVKTLHPRIHGAILADRGKESHRRELAEQGIVPIDVVVVNLYPFRETLAAGRQRRHRGRDGRGDRHRRPGHDARGGQELPQRADRGRPR